MIETEAPEERLWTPANIVTLIRICLVPVFVLLFLAPWTDYFPSLEDGESWKAWVAAIAFVVIAATDALDGYLARSRNEVTNFGKFMDPLADKILVLAALLALTEMGVLPSWVTLIIMSREFIVSGLRMIAATQGTVIAASWYGKAKTVTQMIAIVLFIVKDEVILDNVQAPFHTPIIVCAWVMMLVALTLTVVSMLDYLAKSKELLGFKASKDGAKGSAKGIAAEAGAAGAAVPGASGCESSAVQASLHEVERRLGPAVQDGTRRGIACEERSLISDDALHDAAVRVVEGAVAQGVTLGTAESLTGGMIASWLTSVPGSSEAVRGAVVSYVNDVKRERLGVAVETLEHQGAVSEQTACEMAAGARAALGCDLAVSVTGIAGPGGDEPGKPVGTVWIGRHDRTAAGKAGPSATRFCLPGDREEVRRLTVRLALEEFEAMLKG